MRLLTTCLLVAGSTGLAQAARVVYDWNITYATANPDGLYERKVVGVNGAWPPPVVEATINDTLVINVNNQLDTYTALHSHGMFQNNTPWMDGPVGVTQCAIAPGLSLTYEFNLTQHGSYWIHSHYMGQYMDGLRTPFIIHNINETYTYDYDVTVPLQDWYHAQSTENIGIFLSEDNPTGAEPVPDSGFLGNGADFSLNFVPGKTYRLRLINTSGFSMFYFSIDGHTLDVIEIDGIETERQSVQSVYLTAAQRVSVLVTAKNSTDINYYMHADMNTDMFDTLPDALVYNLTAPIYYNNASSDFYQSEDIGMASTWSDFDLVPLEKQDVLPHDHQVNLTFDFDVTTDGVNRGMFNEVPYLSPKVPTLNTLFSEGNYSLSSEVYGPQTQAIVLNHLENVEIILNNLDSGAHPFHLHGHVFQLVGSGEGVYTGNDSVVEWHLSNPARRDTVLVPAESFVLVRFRADNPGVWFFHCHIEWHLESGLAAVFVEAPDVAQQRMTLPQAFKDVCTDGGFSATGNAAAKEGLDLDGAPNGIYLLYDGFTAKGKGAMAGCCLAALLGMIAIVFYSRVDPHKEAKAIAAAKAGKM
ncbi:multicopper oxidase-domain-containing protein [Gilbertella persicaria]|uniref:multicopper oxidase-domain-containing protein n=1 Tax=Gilbertella persicaria TaxID=101096 RepID=UPI002220076C|nr:multicopper oxidase-domain-containing protein [Gilbertella persicaria]KAI8050168.1 multicopper oxidase-domain-containing protein [Gilbertella persicaria]